MSEQKYSVDDILEELKQKESQQKQEAYRQARRYDTQSLLDEILGHHPAAPAAEPKPEKKAPAAEQTPPKPEPKVAGAEQKPAATSSEKEPAASSAGRFTLDEEALRQHQREQGKVRSPLWSTREFEKVPAQPKPAQPAPAVEKKPEEPAPSGAAETLEEKAEEYDNFRRRREEMIQGFTLKTPPHLEEGQQMPVSSPDALKTFPAVGMSKERTAALQEKLKQFHTGQTGQIFRAQPEKPV